MKTIYLIFNRIRRYWQSNKTVFLLFFIGNIVTALFFTYFYGNTQFMQKANDAKLANRMYTIELYTDINCNDKTVSKLKESDLIEVVELVSVEYAKDYSNLTAVIKGHKNQTVSSGRNAFRENENYSIIVDWFQGFNIGDKIKIKDKEFDVIGTTGVNSVISVVAFTALDLKVSSIKIYTAQKYRQGQDGEILHFISESLNGNGATVIPPSITPVSDILLEIILLCLCFSLSVISFLFLLQHLIDSIMYETVVSLIVGASRPKIFLMTFFEVMLCSTATSTIGILIHRILYNPVFEKINKIPNTTYLFSDYIYVFIIYNLLVAIIASFFLLKYMKLSPVDARRKCL